MVRFFIHLSLTTDIVSFFPVVQEKYKFVRFQNYSFPPILIVLHLFCSFSTYFDRFPPILFIFPLFCSFSTYFVHFPPILIVFHLFCSFSTYLLIFYLFCSFSTYFVHFPPILIVFHLFYSFSPYFVPFPPILFIFHLFCSLFKLSNVQLNRSFRKIASSIISLTLFPNLQFNSDSKK